MRRSRRRDRKRLVEKLEDALGSGHGRLQNIEFLAQVLNGPEEALRVKHKCEQHADLNASRNRFESARPIKQCETKHAEEFHCGIEEGERVNGLLVSFHVDAVQFLKLLARFPFAVKELHDGHATDMFLQKRVDPRDGRADAAVRVAHFVSEEIRQENHEWQRRKSYQSQEGMPLE